MRSTDCNRSRKIVGLWVTTHTDAATAAAIRDALTKRLRTKPSQPDPQEDTWVWTGGVRADLRYSEDYHGLELQIGTGLW